MGKDDAGSQVVFPRRALTFLDNLSKNNNKEWFDEHKQEYNENVLEMLRVLVLALGNKMSKKLPGLRFDPKVNGSIFRIYRDVRFSKDKTPYKTHAACFWWVGPAQKLSCPGIYFHLEPKNLMLGAGIYMIDKAYMENYRRYVSENGDHLAGEIMRAEKAGFTLGGESYARVPSPYPQDHGNAELLKMKGLHISKSYPSKVVTQGNLIKWLEEEYKPTLSLVKILEKALF
jgi:uncharacterized protein (TIGR02453 family)